ncbi:hypothetical protein B296_00049161, partial [Ensete ventricosum]
YVASEVMIEEEGSGGKQDQQEAEKAEGEGSGCGRRGKRGDQGCDWQRRKEEGSGSHQRLAMAASGGEERKKGRRWQRLAWLHKGGVEGDDSGCCGWLQPSVTRHGRRRGQQGMTRAVAWEAGYWRLLGAPSMRLGNS